MSLLGIIRDQHLLLLLVAQLVTSLYFIYRCQNKLSYFCELLLIAVSLLCHTPTFKLPLILCYFLEYILLKFLLILIVYLAKRFAFFILVIISHKEIYKKAYKFLISKKRFLRLQGRIWNTVNYGIRIKKGLPSMVNKRNANLGISFDKDGFPKFKAIAEITLERKYLKKDRSVHFYRANRKLYERIIKNSRLAKKFTKHEISEFKQGQTPSKYTWHHHQNKGLLQLVEYDIHSKVRHDGGFSIWGPKQ